MYASNRCMSSSRYESEMKEYYKHDEVAGGYHRAFDERQGRWRHRVIAGRERKVVADLLAGIPHGSILDIPTGTGKLAPVFNRMNATVMACDISGNMLALARKEFERRGAANVRYRICDAERLTETIEETFDVAVCLRLLHRVPEPIKRSILKQLAGVARYVIVSTAVESGFHSLRRKLRFRLMGGDERAHCYETPERTHRILSDGFQVLRQKPVLPLLSQEYVYLLQPDGRGKRTDGYEQDH